jgi:hypothetical protein
MKRYAVSFLAGVTFTGAAIAAAGQGSGALLAGFLVALAAFLALAVAVGARRLASVLIAIAEASEAAWSTPGPEFTELRAELVAELVDDGAEYDDADAAVSQAAVTGPRSRAPWLRRSRAILRAAKVRRIDTDRRA